MKTKLIPILFAAILFASTGCDKDTGSVNFFTLEQDIQFGQQLKAEIASNPSEYPVMDKTTYPEAYTHIERIKNAVLQSDDLIHGADFEWEVYIIHDDNVLNAFAAPGGYMYFYTGLIKFLDNESQLAGVMAHEIAHADRRHSTENMTKIYGFDILLSVLLGDNPSQLAEIAAAMAKGLSSLKFSRNHEYEADEYAVKYLYDTSYHPKGIAGFFEKLESFADQQSSTPEFLSTHPSPDNRLEEIDKHWKELGSKVGEDYLDRYNQFKESLPAK